jgi:hypothetical protein
MTVSDSLQTARTDRKAIVTLDVVHLGRRVLTPVRIEPGDLDERDDLRRFCSKDTRRIGELLDLIESSAPVPSGLTPELRWKVTFRDAIEKPVLEVWHNNYEPYGQIGTIRVKFAHDGILRFLHAHFDPND